MDPWLIDFGWLIGSFIFGIFLGCLTGLIPGFHVNNVALIALSLSPVAVGIGIPLDAVAGIIVACGTVHTFLNYIPSALVGAPDDNMALALLPGHRMFYFWSSRSRCCIFRTRLADGYANVNPPANRCALTFRRKPRIGFV
ncbi:MAG: hypothetical protein Ct9H90mP23_2180 [Methanobacteriota archaeon]|nr:MAG: hypothetical protein Ct9H90mP23_2180 [Euryarchaeota archaeon]